MWRFLSASAYAAATVDVTVTGRVSWQGAVPRLAHSLQRRHCPVHQSFRRITNNAIATRNTNATTAPKASRVAKALVPDELKSRVRDLRKQLKAANEKYYGGGGSSGLSDAQYDDMFKELQKIEATHPS